VCCALRRQSQVIRCRWPATTPVPTSRRVPESSSASARGAPRVPQPAFVHEGPAVGTCRPGTRTRWRQRYRATCRVPVHPALTPGTSAGRKRPMANPARRPSATCWADGRRRRLPQFLGRQHRGSRCQKGGQVHRMSWVMWRCSGSGRSSAQPGGSVKSSADGSSGITDNDSNIRATLRQGPGRSNQCGVR